MSGNAFYENVDYLYQVQTDLEAVEQLKNEMSEYVNQEKNLKRAIYSEEKSIQDEINQTIKKRKNDIEKEYDSQIDANKNKNKKVAAKRDKVKTKRVGERVSEETADIEEEKRRLQVELKTLFKAKHVPSFCMTDFFYANFMLKRLYEFPIALLSFVIVYVCIPVFMYFFSANVIFAGWAADRKTLPCTIVVSLTIFILAFAYIIMLNKLKIRHYDTLKKGREIKDQIMANKRQIKAIRNKINKDTDDSRYGLDEYDDRLRELDKELKSISREKQDAMTHFENETKQIITEEVNDRRLGKLEDMKEELEKLEQEMDVLDEDIKNSSRAIVKEYGVILGEEFCTPEKVEDLISLMEDGTAHTVSEALAAYKGAV